MSPHVPAVERDRWADVLHAFRPLRLLKRHVRHSRLVLGARQQSVVGASLTQLYREVNGFLSTLGVPWWICYGTLLGWHRDGGLVPGDRDVDFGLPLEAYETVWAARHQLPTGLRMFDTTHRHPGPKLYVERDGWEADLYFYRSLGDGRYKVCLRSWLQGDIVPFPESLIHPLRPVTFLGAPTWVPNDAHGWLVHTYGCLERDAVQDPRSGYWRSRDARP